MNRRTFFKRLALMVSGIFAGRFVEELLEISSHDSRDGSNDFTLKNIEKALVKFEEADRDGVPRCFDPSELVILTRR